MALSDQRRLRRRQGVVKDVARTHGGLIGFRKSFAVTLLKSESSAFVRAVT